MYLMGTHIPIYVEGDRTWVDNSWYSDLDLQRNFFSERFGPVRVLGPSLPREEAGEILLTEVTSDDPTLSLHPSFDARTRIREYWPAARDRWRADLAPLLAEAEVVHASVDDPFLPMQLETTRAGIAAGRTTVLVGFDMDVWETLPIQLGQQRLPQKALAVARAVGMDFWMRRLLPKASVAMLKEGRVYDRYHPLAANPREFCHSMYRASDVIDEEVFEARLASLAAGRGIRLGYFGRFVERKGLADALRILAAVRDRGIEASYHLIGGGPQRGDLERLAGELGVAEAVVFEGEVEYGAALHEKARGLDALLFTPTEEDTPRMVYDAFAAGLPLLTSDIFFLRRRAERDGASVVFPVGAIEAGAEAVAALAADRDRFAALSRTARSAGLRHSVDRWFGERLAWTVEAADRRLEREPPGH
ncbi:MAG: glycosyltransferase [Myxococcota bacterium]